jgi:hydrogenase-4 component F
MIIVEAILIIPVLAALACLFLPHRRPIEGAALAGSGTLFFLALYLAADVFNDGPVQYSLWYVDQLSAFMLIIITFVALMVTIYSVEYIGHDYKEKEIDHRQLRSYYVLTQLFLLSMLLVVVSNNLGIMWVAIEGTTLASAFLVGFYEKDTSVEAAWKYLVICSMGIALALFGILLTYASSIDILGASSSALEWTTLRAIAPQLNPVYLRLAFIFIIIGYGTKVGLAPMHTWLPDAHSQAPSPISALLSAVLLNCAFYGILRFFIITELCVPGFATTLMLIFGLLSLGVAAAFIVAAKDIKRLLAYSSIEHMGIMSLGFGLGGYLGIFGALFQMFSHAITKCLLFFGAGNILQKYGTKNIDEVKGVMSIMPMTGGIFLLGALAIAGSPPFSIFIGEVAILQAGLSTQSYVVSALYLLLLVIIFAALMYHVSRMMFGKPTEGVAKGEMSLISLVPMVILLSIILIIGIFLPQSFTDMISDVASIFPGGAP